MAASAIDISNAWLAAIDDATACLRVCDESGVEQALGDLAELEATLRTQEDVWDHPPSQFPRIRKKEYTGDYSKEEEDETETTVGYDYEEEDDDDDDDDGGDRPLTNWTASPPPQPRPNSRQRQTQPPSSPMVMLRLMIRIMSFQSELYALKASRALHSRDGSRLVSWKHGVELYCASLDKIHNALFLADSEIVRLHCMGEAKVAYLELQVDADIVDISISRLTEARDKYERAAKKQEQILLRKLQPQWSSRDQARQRLGEDRWINNPHPKNVQRRQRVPLEQELRDVQAALEELQSINTSAVQATSHELRERLLAHGGNKGAKSRKHRITNKQRYNGNRPSIIARRLPLLDYPDPIDFGWTFTGSWDNMVEFFEKSIQSPDDGEDVVVKLDWYFTTGTIKTSMEHPRQGRTQLFSARATPEVYVQILQDPRTHTGARYHRRANKPKFVPAPAAMKAQVSVG